MCLWNNNDILLTVWGFSLYEGEKQKYEYVEQ